MSFGITTAGLESLRQTYDALPDGKGDWGVLERYLVARIEKRSRGHCSSIRQPEYEIIDRDKGERLPRRYKTAQEADAVAKSLNTTNAP
jgi:hypothetical protein